MMPGNPVVGGTVLRRAAVQSPNFITGSAGWTVNADGTAEFSSITIRGTITGATIVGGTITGVTISGATFTGPDFIINSSGSFYYSGTPAANNMTSSQAPAAGTDSFGNHYLAGVTSYGSGTATQLTSGLITFYTGSLAAGWTSRATQQFFSPFVAFSTGMATQNNTLDDGSGNADFTGSVQVGGTSLTVGNGSTADIVLNPPMAIPPNRPTAGKTLAQTQAFIDGMFNEMEGRGFFT